MAEAETQEAQQEQEEAKAEGWGAGNWLGTATGLLGIAFAKALGTHFMIAFVLALIGVAAAAFLASKFLPPKAKPFIASFSIQTGHLLWMIITITISGQFSRLSAIVLDLVVFGLALTWLAARPGVAPILTLVALQTVMIVLNGLQLSGAWDIPAAKTLIAVLMLRTLAIALMFLELHGFLANGKSRRSLQTASVSDDAALEAGSHTTLSQRRDNRMRRVIVPALLLAVLLVAYVARWQVVATKSYAGGVVKWVQDRWTGQVWSRSYGGNAGYEEAPEPEPVDTSPWWRLRNYLSWSWDALVVADALWLLVALRRGLRYSPNKEAPPV